MECITPVLVTWFECLDFIHEGGEVLVPQESGHLPTPGKRKKSQCQRRRDRAKAQREQNMAAVAMEAENVVPGGVEPTNIEEGALITAEKVTEVTSEGEGPENAGGIS